MSSRTRSSGAWCSSPSSTLGGNILVEAETTSSGTWRDRTWYGYALASVGEELRRLSSVIGGPDMLFTVAEGPAGRPRRVLRIGTPYLGQQGSPWVWQYGGNVRAYRWDSDGSRSARRVFATGDGMEQGTPIAVAEDRDALTAWPLLETERGYSSVRETATLQSHADADQAAARLPVVTIQLTVDGTRYPQVGVWAVGDDSRVVIDDEFHQRRPGRDHGLDTTVRIIGADISVTEQGEDVTLTMAPLLEDVA
nr:hypothetical protein GCM10020241_47890 [Streptoalloteichus tenebrarius]